LLGLSGESVLFSWLGRLEATASNLTHDAQSAQMQTKTKKDDKTR
jgi:hypothetical protein